MAETGIEDLVRGEGNSGGCLSAVIYAFLSVSILLALLGLLSWYCGPAPKTPPANVTTNSNMPTGR